MHLKIITTGQLINIQNNDKTYKECWCWEIANL